MDLYSLRSTPFPGEYTIIKFDQDYSILSIYALSASTCTCPQGFKPKCKHRRMLQMFLEHGHVDDGWFLIWQSRLWLHPVGEPSEPPAIQHGAPASLLADTTVLGNTEQGEAIAARMAPALATEGSNAVLASGAIHQGLSPINHSGATNTAPPSAGQPKPGELRRRRF